MPVRSGWGEDGPPDDYSLAAIAAPSYLDEDGYVRDAMGHYGSYQPWDYNSINSGLSNRDPYNLNALWGGTQFQQGRVSDWSHIDSSNLRANQIAGQARESLWNDYNNLRAQGVNVKTPDQVAFEFMQENGGGGSMGYGPGVNTAYLTEALRQRFYGQDGVAGAGYSYTPNQQLLQEAESFGDARRNAAQAFGVFEQQGQGGNSWLKPLVLGGITALTGGALAPAFGGGLLGSIAAAAATSGITSGFASGFDPSTMLQAAGTSAIKKGITGGIGELGGIGSSLFNSATGAGGTNMSWFDDIAGLAGDYGGGSTGDFFNFDTGDVGGIDWGDGMGLSGGSYDWESSFNKLPGMESNTGGTFNPKEWQASGGGFLDGLMKNFGGLFNNALGTMSGMANQGMLSTLAQLASGLYGFKQADKLGDTMERIALRSDPFGPYRPGYAEELKSLRADPSQIVNRPGYKAGLDAVERKMASQGFNSSGNMMAALQEYGGNFYNAEQDRLANLAGAQFGPQGSVAAAGATGQYNAENAALARLGMAVPRSL